MSTDFLRVELVAYAYYELFRFMHNEYSFFTLQKYMQTKRGYFG